MPEGTVNTYIVETYNPVTKQRVVSNVMTIDNLGENTTREELAQVVFETGGYPFKPCETAPYPDVPAGSYYCPAIQAMTEYGVMSGDSDGYFYPAYGVNRAEAAKVLAKGFKVQKEISEGAPHFWDVPDTTWYYNFVEYLYTILGTQLGFDDQSYRPSHSSTDGWVQRMAMQLPKRQF